MSSQFIKKLTALNDISETLNQAVDVRGALQDALVSLVKLVGVDYLSVAPFKQPGGVTHHRLLENDVLVVEGLRLGGLVPGVYPFVVLPLALAGADGAPCRAFIGQEESGS